MKAFVRVLFAVFMTGCAGTVRSCQGYKAERFGADWLVVQYRMDGSPMNCWRLSNTSISNEHASDGIYWYEQSGHLVHISGWYNRVQVNGGDWDGASKTIGVEAERCRDGKYTAGEYK